jgi:hypothetical protein
MKDFSTILIIGVLATAFFVLCGVWSAMYETVAERQMRCVGYFERVDKNHESLRDITLPDDYDFCLNYSKEYFAKHSI